MTISRNGGESGCILFIGAVIGGVLGVLIMHVLPWLIVNFDKLIQ